MILDVLNHCHLRGSAGEVNSRFGLPSTKTRMYPTNPCISSSPKKPSNHLNIGSFLRPLPPFSNPQEEDKELLPLPPPLADGTRQVLVTIPRRKTCPRVAWSCRPGLGGEPLEEPVFEGKPCGTPEGLTLLIQ